MSETQITKGQTFKLLLGVGGTYIITKVTAATVYYTRINEDGELGGYFKAARRNFSNPTLVAFA